MRPSPNSIRDAPPCNDVTLLPFLWVRRFRDMDMDLDLIQTKMPGRSPVLVLVKQEGPLSSEER